MRKIIFILASLAVLIYVLYLLFSHGVLWPVYPDREQYPIRGVDVSYHKGSIDWDRVAHDDMKFAYLKATEGDDFKDSKFQENWKAANAAKLWVGAYHFYSLRFGGEVQAKNFIDSVPVQKESLPPVVDLEYGGNSVARPSKTDFQKELTIYLDLVRKNYRQEPILYVTEKFYDDYLYPEFKDSPIWIRSLFHEPSSKKFPSWQLWQYKNRGHVNGIDGYVDLDVMRKSDLMGMTAPLPQSSDAPKVKDEQELTEEKVDEELASLGCEDDSTTRGMEDCNAKTLKYLEQQIVLAENKFKDTAKHATPEYADLLKTQLKNISISHAQLQTYADAFCDLQASNYDGGTAAGPVYGFCKVNLYKGYLIALRSHLIYLHPDMYTYPEAIWMFMKNPSSQRWQDVLDDAEKGRLGPKNSAYTQLVVYRDARVHRDLPNSMALEGITPNDYVALQAAKADASLALIRTSLDDAFWKLLERMSSQGFDEDLVITSSELAARLSPRRFNDFEENAIQANPKNTWILERIREKWIR